MKFIFWLAGGLSLLQFWLLSGYSWASTNPAHASDRDSVPPSDCALDALQLASTIDPLGCLNTVAAEEPLGQVRSVDELSDVQPTDWAYQALKSLVEKYGVISGYSDRTFRGNRALTRYEFAATLSAVMAKVEEQLLTGKIAEIREDFATLKRLQDSYDAILTDLRDRIAKLDPLTARLEQQQFSTTTKLKAQTVFGFTDGSNAITTILTRVRLDFNTSFTGTDLLRTQLEAGNNGGDAISNRQNRRGPNLLGTNGILADGGGADFVEVPNTVQISKLYYTFQPIQNLNLIIGARLNPRDFIDYNRFANDSLTNFNSSFFMNNPLIVQNQVDRPGGAGAALSWKPTENSPLTLRALYVAADAGTPAEDEGLFGGRNQGSVELEYAFHKNLIARLQYTTATVNRTAINAGGFNFEWRFNRQFAAFGRFGIGSYNGFNSLLRQDLDLHPKTWALGGTIRDIVIPGSVAGLAIGQPFIERDIGDATQLNVEGYYSFDLNDSISFSPAFLIVANPNNRSTGAIFEWFLRLVYTF
ncbi:MAG: carbohydrate porin [Oscillatoriales cyanobacterium C42_A2020_001]|nr:carbohydrate porin [Leptolyngbyaceae cyanobacterium C42_A2020_001]